MDFGFHELRQRSLLSPTEQPFSFFSQSQPQTQFPSQNLQPETFNLNNKVSPSILLIIIILAIIFFVSGLLHLLVRFLWRPQIRDPDDFDNVTALQGQLQQLFHLHDSGVDQSFIDTLPVFHYKAIIGTKNPFDCAVCLCEFGSEDKLRLLPKCSHAFHMDCIDTWLLSHSTCPLCRASLVSDFSPNNSCSPIVLVLESGSESSREINNVTAEREAVIRTNSNSNSHLGFIGDNELGSERFDFASKSGDFEAKDDPDPDPAAKIVPVKLGKFRNVDGVETSGTSTGIVDARRCFSMGSFEYVLDENSCLQVPIRTPLKKQPSKKPSLPLTPGHRPAMSVCDCESRRGFIGFEAMRSSQTNLKSSSVGEGDGKAISKSPKESFSISKIWLRGKKEKANLEEDSSRRAFSFRIPAGGESDDALAAKNVGGGGGKSCISEMAISELGSCRWENGGTEQWWDEENQSCNSLDLPAKTPSFTRRTLQWLVGRQNKVVHSSFTPNV